MSVTRTIMIAGLACTLFGGFMLAQRAMTVSGAKQPVVARHR